MQAVRCDHALAATRYIVGAFWVVITYAELLPRFLKTAEKRSLSASQKSRSKVEVFVREAPVMDQLAHY